MLKRIFEILLLFLFVFGVPFKGIPLNTSKWIVILLFLMYLMSHMKYGRFIFKRDFLYITFCFFILLILSLLYTLFHSTNDFTIPYAYFILIFEGLLGSYLYVLFFIKNKSLDYFFHLLIIVGTIQAFIIIMMFIFEPFRTFIFSITSVDAEQLMERYNGFRGFGLAGSVTYDLAVFLSIVLVFSAYLLTNTLKNKLYLSISFAILLIAILMTGRTGWLGIFFSFFLLLINSLKSFNLKTLIYMSLTLFIIIEGIPNLLQSYFPTIYDIVYLEIIPYAFEMFINYSETGRFSTNSSDVLQNMYFPISSETFLFGDGYYKDPYGKGYYMGTDAGYMRQLLFYGIIPSLLLYFSYLYGFFVIYFKLRFINNLSILIIFLACLYFLVQYKGSFLTGSGMNIKLFGLLLSYSILNSKYLLNKSKFYEE